MPYIVTIPFGDRQIGDHVPDEAADKAIKDGLGAHVIRVADLPEAERPEAEPAPVPHDEHGEG